MSPRLPLSKFMHMPDDYGMLPQAQRYLQQVPDLLEGQHVARVWEYGMAVEAILRWVDTHHDDQDLCPLQILDAGGHTSNLWKVLSLLTTADVVRVDPSFPTDIQAVGPQAIYRMGLTEFAGATVNLGQVDIITCISVIEHIPDDPPDPAKPSPLTAFCRAAHALLKPGGLLVITTDAWNAEGPDTAHFHWMRERIYNPESLRRLGQRLRRLGLSSFGGSDWTWHGPQVYDYAMASLVLTKDRTPTVPKEPSHA